MDLNNSEEIKKLDSGHVADSIEKFADQVEQAWAEATQIASPTEYQGVKNILAVGMGGSALGADIVRNLFRDSLKVPLTISNDYSLPNFVDQSTLVLLLSYSGTTEEVLSAADEAKAKRAKLVGITVGGELGNFLKDNNYPAYIFDPKANPSGQPRLGLGYTMVGLILILQKLELLKLDTDVNSVITKVRDYTEKLNFVVPMEQNHAKTLAQKLFGKEVFIVAGEFLSGNAHVFANQTNENAKNFASYFVLPELNHHLLEGLTDPKTLPENLHFVFLQSGLYSEKIQKRVSVTKEVLEKLGIAFSEVQIPGEDKLTQVLSGIVFSSCTTFYLGALNGVDPVKIPWVDYFKKRLAE